MKKYLKVFLLTFLILLFILLILGVYPFGDKTLIVSDLRDQYLVFINYLKSIILGNNTFFYTFSGALGESFIPLMSYYLISVFNLLTLPFNGNLMPLIITIIILIKISLCSVSMNYFLDKKYGEDKKNIIFSLCYALMSYTIAFYFHIMWLDVVILLPLVILGIERIINNNKSLLYIISLTLTILSNYYLGVIVCIFSVLYFVYYLLCNKKKNIKKIIIKYLISSLLSGMVCMVILLPVFYSVFNSKVLFETEATPFFFNTLDIFSKTISFSFDNSSIWHGGPNIFVGTFTILGIILYYSNKKINKRKKIITTIFLLFFFLTLRVHKLDLLFHGLSEPNCFDFRHAFIISFFLILIGYEGISNYKKIDKIHLWYFGVIVIYIIVLFFNFSYFSNERIIFLILSLLLTLLFIYLVNKKEYKYLYLLVIIELMINTGNILGVITSYEKNASNIPLYQEYFNNNDEVINDIKKMDQSFYRLEKDYHHSNNINDSMLFNYYGISHFDSTSNPNTEKFLENIGFRRVVSRSFYDLGSTKAADMLLGIKYILSYDNHFDYKILFNKNNINVYSNPYYTGLGFIIDDYSDIIFSNNPFDNLNKVFKNITKTKSNLYENVSYQVNAVNINKKDNTYYKIGEEAYITYKFNALTNNNYYLYFNDNLVRDNYKKADIIVNDIKINDYFDKYNYGMINLGRFNIGDDINIKISLISDELTIPDGIIAYEKDLVFNEIYDYLSNNSILIKMNNSSSLEMDVNGINRQVILSIPYEEGWKITSNNEEINYYKTYNGLIGFTLPNEVNHIIMKYTPKGFKTGLIISIISLITTIYVVYKEEK